MNPESFKLLKQCFESDDLAGAAKLLEDHPRERDADGSNDCGSLAHVFSCVRSVNMADLILRNGVTTDQVSEWWAPGFGLDRMPAAVAEHLIERGAVPSVHTMAALGLTERLRALLDKQPGRLEAKGGDGARPLHFSRTVEIARLLVDRGAELDPRDDDHDSAPAQWRIGDAPDVTRFLLDRGARADIFMAAAFGDLALATRLIDADPDCTRYRIGNNKGPFPGIGFKSRGGTIYQWTLGFNRSPQEIAHERGHQAVFDYLMQRTSAKGRLLVHCMLADRPAAEALVATAPGLVGEMDDDDRALLAKCCWETNLNKEAVRLMLDLGFPIAAREFNHGYLALHNAAWCGDAELVDLLLKRGHPVEPRDPTYHATALGFAIHSCVTAQRHPEGDFPRVIRLLLEAGTPLDERHYPSGNDAIDAAIEAFQRKKGSG